MEVADPQGNGTTRASRTWRVAVAVALVGLCAATPLTAAHRQASANAGPGGKPPTILFMCPHGAGKSVLASAYFQRLAKERGLNVRVVSAGTDPDPEVAPAVAKHLKKQGYEVPVAKPRRATDEDILAADVVVSIGCELKNLPKPPGTLVQWDDVPAPSEDFARADKMIRERVLQLVDELARQQVK
jgi:arsenate reductase (thioredoxin)